MIVITATIQEGHETFLQTFDVDSDFKHGVSCKAYVEECLNRYNRKLPNDGIERELLLINDVKIKNLP